MATYLPPIVWCEPSGCDTPQTTTTPTTVTEPPAVSIETVGDYIEAHRLELMIANPGLRDMAIGDVTVEHDSVAQLTYFTQDGIVIGSASWPMPQDGPEMYAGRGQQAAQQDRGA